MERAGTGRRLPVVKDGGREAKGSDDSITSYI